MAKRKVGRGALVERSPDGGVRRFRCHERLVAARVSEDDVTLYVRRPRGMVVLTGESLRSERRLRLAKEEFQDLVRFLTRWRRARHEWAGYEHRARPLGPYIMHGYLYHPPGKRTWLSMGERNPGGPRGVQFVGRDEPMHMAETAHLGAMRTARLIRVDEPVALERGLATEVGGVYRVGSVTVTASRLDALVRGKGSLVVWPDDVRFLRELAELLRAPPAATVDEQLGR